MLDLKKITDWSNQLIEPSIGGDEEKQWKTFDKTQYKDLSISEKKFQVRIWKEDFALDSNNSIKKITQLDNYDSVFAAGYIRRMMEIRRYSVKLDPKRSTNAATILHENASEWSLQKILVVIMINPSASDDTFCDHTTDRLYTHLPAEYDRLILLNVTPVIATEIENLNKVSTQRANMVYWNGSSKKKTDDQFTYINHYRVKPEDFEPDGKIELPKLFVDNSEARENAKKIQSENRELVKHVIHTLGGYQESSSDICSHQQPFDILLATGNPRNKKSCGSILPVEYNKMITCLQSAIKDVNTVGSHPQVKRIVTEKTQSKFTPFSTSADASSKFGAHPLIRNSGNVYLDPAEDDPETEFFYRLESYHEEG